MKRNIPIQAIAALLVTAGVFMTGGIPRFLAPWSQPLAPTTQNLIAGTFPSANVQVAEKSTAPAGKTASPSPLQIDGCAPLPYKGTPPLSQLPPVPVPEDDVDCRGGVRCRFVINPKLPVFTFHFAAQGENPLGKIEIGEASSKKIIQIIPNPVNPYFADVDPLRILKLVDANFDGYNDFAIQEGCGVTGNCAYDFYL